MAKYDLTLYFGTGFNAVNVPDSLQTLQHAATSTLTIRDNNISHVRGLTSFTIAATYAQVKDADYCYVINQLDSTDYAFFAIVGDPKPESDTVMTISVIMDPLISAGGISAITFLGGITERYCVPVAEDTFGAFTEPDPYMAPAQALQIERGALVGNGTSDYTTFYQSLIALDFLHLFSQAYEQVRSVYTDYTIPGLNVYSGGATSSSTATAFNNTIHSEIPVNAFTVSAGWDGSVQVLPTGEAYFTDRLLVTDAPADYVSKAGAQSVVLNALGTTQVYKGIQFAKSLGIETPVLNSWQIPGTYLKDIEMVAGHISYTDGNGFTYTTTGNRSGRVQRLIGINDDSHNSTLPFEYTNVKNRRVLIGENNRYCLASTCSGSKAEYNPEDIYDYTHPTTAPYIWLIADPRPGGMPYARYKILHGDHSIQLFFMNAVPGMVWQRVPLTYHDKTGNLLDQTRFQAEQKTKDETAAIEGAKQYGVIAGIGSGGIGAIAGSLGAITTGAAGAVRGLMTGDMSLFRTGDQALSELANPAEKIERERRQQRDLEQQQYLVSQSIVSPTLDFPRNESIRDMVGNGFLAYRYRYTDADASRIDRILTMYGYRITAPVTAANSAMILGGRPHFNYVSIKGASVTSAAPKWINDQLSEALSTGIRIWHEKPDNSYYTNGNT